MSSYYLKKAFGAVFNLERVTPVVAVVAGSAAATVMTMTSLVTKEPSTEEDPVLAAQQMQVHERRIETLENLQAKINRRQNDFSAIEFEKYADPKSPEKEKSYETAKTDLLELQTQMTNLKSAFAKGVVLDPQISEARGQMLANRFERSFGQEAAALTSFKVTRPMTPNNHGFSYLQECRAITAGGIEELDGCMHERAFNNDFAVFSTGMVSLLFGGFGGYLLMAAGARARAQAEEEAKRREKEQQSGEVYTSMTQKIVVKEIKGSL